MRVLPAVDAAEAVHLVKAFAALLWICLLQLTQLTPVWLASQYSRQDIEITCLQGAVLDSKLVLGASLQVLPLAGQALTPLLLAAKLLHKHGAPPGPPAVLKQQGGTGPTGEGSPPRTYIATQALAPEGLGLLHVAGKGVTSMLLLLLASTLAC